MWNTITRLDLVISDGPMQVRPPPPLHVSSPYMFASLHYAQGRLHRNKISDLIGRKK